MTTTVVFKVGGSLLSLPDLGPRLERVLKARKGTRPLLVMGGGPTTDLVRDWDRVHKLGEERSHWLAIKSLRLNEQLLAELLSNSNIVTNRESAELAWNQGALPILCADDFIGAEESSVPWPLPHTWEVTSDSIAAWVVLTWPADELVLLKSRPFSPTAAKPDSHPLVDAHFSKLAESLPRISWVNLRSSCPKFEDWSAVS